MQCISKSYPKCRSLRFLFVLGILLTIMCLSLCFNTMACSYQSWEQKFQCFKIKKSSMTTNFEDTITLKDIHGNVILNKDIKELWQQPLRMWDYKNEMLTFVHIVKSSGTSFSRSLLRSWHKDGCSVTCLKPKTLGNRTCPSKLHSYCTKHFDWNQVEELENAGIKTAPLVLLRNPIDRAVSHFYYVQTKDVNPNKDMRLYNQSFSEYLQDPESMMESRFVWNDGQASTAWLAGVHSAAYVAGNVPTGERLRRKSLQTNWTFMLDTAINNLHKCLWFGILEDLDKSFEMLRYQSGLNVSILRENKTPKNYEKLTQSERDKLQTLIPMDMYFYEYAKQLHAYRYSIFKEQQQQHKEQQQQQQDQEKTISLQLPRFLYGCNGNLSLQDCPLFDMYLNKITYK